MGFPIDAENTQLGLMIFFTILSVIIPIPRWFIMRKQTQTTTDRISSGFFYFSCILTSGICTTLSYGAHEGVLMAQRLQEPELTSTLLGTNAMKIFFFCRIFYLVALWAIKGAFLSFYWRLFSRGQRRLRWVLYGAIAFWACASVGCFFYFVFWCLPIKNNWSPDPVIFVQYSVLLNLAHNTITVFLNMFTDMIVLIVPLLIIPSLQLQMREKLGLICVFAVGGMSITSSAIRYFVIYKFITHPPMTPAGLKSQELWSVAELLTAILAYTLPACEVLIKCRARAKTESSTGMSGSEMSDSRKKQTGTGIYVRHDIDIRSVNGSSDGDLGLANLPSGTSHEGLVHPPARLSTFLTTAIRRGSKVER